MQKLNRLRYLIPFSAAMAVASFQNCAQVNFESTLPGVSSLSSSAKELGVVTLAPCDDFNGQTIQSGDSVIAYSRSSVAFGQSCMSQNRICTDGVLSGSYQFATCVVNAPANCNINGQTIVSGQSASFFREAVVDFGSTCVSESRSCVNGIASGSFTHVSCTVADPPRSCDFAGRSIVSGSAVNAYRQASVPFGQTCQMETRVCSNGMLSGTFTAPSCTVGAPAKCTIRGVDVSSGSSILAYALPSVPYGQTCESQTRSCVNGVLSGTFPEATCAVGPAANCTFDGTTVLHGNAVRAFQAALVPFGQSCVSENRVCNNAMLSGSYASPTCVVDAPLSCSLKGQTIPSGNAVTAYQSATVPYGQTCQSESRSCMNGNLSGAFEELACSPLSPNPCVFNGRTISSGGAVIAFQSATVPFGQTCTSQSRVCTNGTLSGAFTAPSCVVGLPAQCNLAGQTVTSGDSVIAFETESVPFGQTCRSEPRACLNGNLSGSFAKSSCAALPPLKCDFNGTLINHNANVTAYVASSVPFGQTCTSEQRTCFNGILSGTAPASSCTVQPAVACTFNSGTVANGASVTTYAAASVPFGQTCTPQTRTCSNGTLSGSGTITSCTVQPAASCPFNSGTVAHGASVTTYAAASVPFGQTCTPQTRTCSNGTLSGSGTATSCAAQSPMDCSQSGVAVAHGASRTFYSAASVPDGSTCQGESRSCTNGILSGSFTAAACTVQAPVCPAPMACAAMRTAATSGGALPAVFYGSSAPTGSQTASNSVCQAVNVTQLNGIQSGNTSVIASNINQVFTQAAGNLYLNANSIGDYRNYTTSPHQTAIVARSVGNYTIEYSSTDNCITSQNVASVMGQRSISLYGRKEGGVRGTVGMINVGAPSESVYVKGFELTVSPVVQVAAFTGIDVKMPSFVGAANELVLDRAEITGLLQPSNSSRATISNTTVGGDFGMGTSISPLTVSTTIVAGQMRISNNTNATVSSSSINGGLQIATSGSAVFSNTKIVGAVSVGNTSVATFNNGTKVTGNTTLYNMTTTTIDGAQTVFTGNIRVTNGAKLTVSGGAKIRGQISGDLWDAVTLTGAGTTIDELALSGQQGPITLSNGAIVTKLTSSNAVIPYTQDAYVINCTGGAKVLQKVTLSGKPVVLNNCN